MSMESDAKEVAIHNLLDGYSMLRVTDAFIDATVRAVEPFSLTVVLAALDNFATGMVPGKDVAYPPQVPEIAAECRRMQGILEPRGALPHIRPVPDGYGTVAGGRLLVVPIGRTPPPGFRTIGPERVNFGGRDIDLTSYTPEQKDYILALKRLPASPDEEAALRALGNRMIASG